MWHSPPSGTTCGFEGICITSQNQMWAPPAVVGNVAPLRQLRCCVFVAYNLCVRALRPRPCGATIGCLLLLAVWLSLPTLNDMACHEIEGMHACIVGNRLLTQEKAIARAAQQPLQYCRRTSPGCCCFLAVVTIHSAMHLRTESVPWLSNR